MKAGVLALQGAFEEHEKALNRLGIDCVQLRQLRDLETEFDGIVLPGGESTVQGKLLHELSMFDLLAEKIKSGIPVLATCAGMILLASEIEDENYTYFASVPMTVKRNAYGRQLGSFHTEGYVEGVGNVPMTFIRAPYASKVYGDARVLAEVDGKAVAVKYKNQLALAFHPELDANLKIHRSFVELMQQVKSGT